MILVFKLKEYLNTILSRVIDMIKKSIQVQLVFFAVFIWVFITLGTIQYSTGMILFDAIMTASKGWFIIIGLSLLVPVGTIALYEFFSKEKEYDESNYNKIAILVIHISGLVLYIILMLSVFFVLLFSLSLLFESSLLAYILVITIFLIVWLVEYLFKKRFGFNMFDILYFKRIGQNNLIEVGNSSHK